MKKIDFMKNICFYFQIHRALPLKRYRFFDIGSDHYYYDDYANETNIHRLTENCYLPANKALLEIIENSNGKFKVSFCISGVMLEQMERFAPEVIDSFKALAKTGSVEFLAETYSNTLASIYDEEEFKMQVKMHSDKIFELFGKRPTAFRNTELLYSDEIGRVVSDLGYKSVIIEGANHILGWKSPNYVYNHPYTKLKLLPRNPKLSDDICFNFSNWSWKEFPLTAEKYIGWIANTPEKEEVFTLAMSYDALGINNNAHSGIFEFLKALPYHASLNKINFATPSELATKQKATDTLTSHELVSWADEEKDFSAWTGNDLQAEALQKLYSVGERVRLNTIAEKVKLSKDRALQYDWLNLQSSAHFYYMSTKHFSGGGKVAHISPYESPYEAFINYMNVLSDFLQRVDEQFPSSIETEELILLYELIDNQSIKIEKLEKKLKGKKEAAPTKEPVVTKEPVAKKKMGKKK